MLCREKKPRAGAETVTVVGTHAKNGAAVKGLLHNRNVRFTDLKRLADESEDAVAGGGPRNGAANENGGGVAVPAKGGMELEQPEQREDVAQRTVVVKFEQGEPCNVTDDEDDGASVTGLDGMKPTGQDDADAFKMADPADQETGCCMQCAYFTVEFCGCSIM